MRQSALGNYEAPTMTRHTLHLRPASPADFEHLHRLENAVFPGVGLSRRAIRRLIELPGAMVIVAALPSTIVSSLIMLFPRGSAVGKLHSLAVSPERRGSGLGTEMLRCAEVQATCQGTQIVQLDLDTENAGAMQFFQRFGYEVTMPVPARMRSSGEILRLEKQLGTRHFVSFADLNRRARSARPAVRLSA
jgi:ribosomal-protein-alanine N-acetyltransferase